MNSNDFDDENYLSEKEEKKDKRMKTLKYIGFSILIILLVVVLLFMLKGCNIKQDGKSNLSESLLEAGKEYFENNEHLFPTSKGECATIDLKVLKDSGLVDKDEFEECSESDTYVKVCKLESGKMHWVPILSCDSYKSEDYFSTWKEGKESDLVNGKSDVRFMFLGKYLDLENANLGEVKELWKDEITLKNYKTLAVINYYSYRDKEYIWNLNEKYYFTSTGDKTNVNDVSEYYTSSPKSGYTNKDSEDSSVAKWYTITTEGTRVYWNNGAYSKNQPDPQYSYYTDGVYQDTYYVRTFTRSTDSQTKAPTHMWECSSSSDPNTVTSFVPCSENVNNPNHKTTVKDFYTCDNGLTPTTQDATCRYCANESLRLSGDKLSCGTYSNWSISPTACIVDDNICYMSRITEYKWYKIEGEVRSYYPSGSANAAGEKIYYKTAPVSGAVKDGSTQTTGYKWYRLVSGQTSGYSVTPPKDGATKTDTYRWTSWTDFSTIKPATIENREIKIKQKIRLQEILSATTEENWKNLTEDYVTEQEMIEKFKALGKPITSLSDINASGDMKYDIKIYYRSLSEEE